MINIEQILQLCDIPKENLFFDRQETNLMYFDLVFSPLCKISDKAHMHLYFKQYTHFTSLDRTLNFETK